MSENLRIDLYLDEDDLSLMPAIEGDKQVKLESQDTIVERVKLKLQERKTARAGLIISTPNKSLTRIQAVHYSYKLKNEIKQRLYILYQHNKFTKKIDNNLTNLL